MKGFQDHPNDEGLTVYHLPVYPILCFWGGRDLFPHVSSSFFQATSPDVCGDHGSWRWHSRRFQAQDPGGTPTKHGGIPPEKDTFWWPWIVEKTAGNRKIFVGTFWSKPKRRTIHFWTDDFWVSFMTMAIHHLAIDGAYWLEQLEGELPSHLCWFMTPMSIHYYR